MNDEWVNKSASFWFDFRREVIRCERHANLSRVCDDLWEVVRVRSWGFAPLLDFILGGNVIAVAVRRFARAAAGKGWAWRRGWLIGAQRASRRVPVCVRISHLRSADTSSVSICYSAIAIPDNVTMSALLTSQLTCSEMQIQANITSIMSGEFQWKCTCTSILFMQSIPWFKPQILLI